MRTLIPAGWRIGLATAALLAAATAASAQTPVLGLNPSNPHINFNGSNQSRVALDLAGNLTIAAGAEFITTPLNQQLLIVSVWNGPRPLDANGRCDSYNVGDFSSPTPTTEVWFYAKDANGANPQCYSEFSHPGTVGGTTTPPGVYGAFNVQTRIDGAGNMLGGTPAGATDACGVLNGDDLCIKGVALTCATGPDINTCFGQGGNAQWQIVQGPGILLTGKMMTNLGTQVFGMLPHGAFGNNTGLDLFELVFQVSGGLLAPQFSPASMSDPRKFVDVVAGGNPGVGTAFTDFNTPFSEGVIGSLDSVTFAMLLPADPCNGRISGTVSNYFSPANGIPGSEVQLSTQPNIVPAANGAYASGANLCAGTYTVTGIPPAGYSVYGADSVTVTIATNSTGTQNTNVSGVNFQMYAAAVSASSFTTFRQAAWGTKPRANNAGALLATYFGFLYPDGELVIGDPLKFTMTETGASAVQDVLPQEGRPVPLTASYIDPASHWKPKHLKKQNHHRRLGSLAGETLALELNVRFSAMALTRFGLGSLKLATGQLAGKTVDQVLAIANSVLGGNALPTGLRNYDDLEDIVELINENFQAGTINRGYLIGQ